MNEPHWLMRPESIRKIWIIFIIILVITVLAGAFIDFHEHFGVEASFGFYAWFGFIACMIMVVAAKLLGFILKRPDTYYDE